MEFTGVLTIRTIIVKNLLITLLVLLTACSPIELYQAENIYQEAKATKNEKLIIASLQSLVMLDPQRYQGKLDKANLAVLELQKANALVTENNLYEAYLASHASYRQLPTIASKAVLIKVGGELRYLLDVHSNVVKSFELLPTSLAAVISKYQNQPVLEWDVIKVNSIIEQLGLAGKALHRSLVILERKKATELSPEIVLWKIAIQNQLKMINQVEQHVINLALSSSSIELEKHNAELTENSANLLSLVREELAQETMQPHFIKANREYQLYFNLNENLALASSSTRRNTHAAWYKDWNHIEKEVLESRAPFSSYLTASSNRANKLRTFINKVKNIRPNLELGFSNLNLFMIQNENTYNLIEKLQRDRMLLNYG